MLNKSHKYFMDSFIKQKSEGPNTIGRKNTKIGPGPYFKVIEKQ